VRDFIANVAPLLHRPEHAKAVQYCLSETIRNVLEHAGGVPAFGAAQFYPESQQVAIGVADYGEGIRSTLSRNYKLQDDAHGVMTSLFPGTTGVIRSPYGGSSDNAGAGLFFTRCIAKSSHSYFAIVSGTAAYRLRQASRKGAFRLHADPEKDAHDLFRGLPAWQGTVVSVNIGLRVLPEFETTMAAIRDVYSAQRPVGKKPKIRFT
jgi:hypothetical protein